MVQRSNAYPMFVKFVLNLGLKVWMSDFFGLAIQKYHLFLPHLKHSVQYRYVGILIPLILSSVCRNEEAFEEFLVGNPQLRLKEKKIIQFRKSTLLT